MSTSPTTDVLVGLAAGAIITGATDRAGLGSNAPAFIGGSCGLVLAILSPQARPGGFALFLSSLAGSAVLTARSRERRQRRVLA